MAEQSYTVGGFDVAFTVTNEESGPVSVNIAITPKPGPVAEVDTETDADGNRLLKIEGVARLLGISAMSVYQMRHNGNFPRHYMFGSSIRVKESDFYDWIEGFAKPIIERDPSKGKPKKLR